MWEEILRLAVSHGLWAVLSCVLLFYLLKDSKKREAKFTSVINDLTAQLKVVNQIKEDIKQINTKMGVLSQTKAVEQAVRNIKSQSRRNTVGTVTKIICND